MEKIDLTKCNNCRYKARLDGDDDYGRIKVDCDCVYLRSDKLDGCVAVWHTDDPIVVGLSARKVTDFEIVARDPETYEDWQVGDSLLNEDISSSGELPDGRVIFRSGEFVVIADWQGNAIPYTCDELYDEGYRLVLTDIEKQIIAEKKVVENIPKPYEFKKGEPVLVRSDRTHCWQLRVISLSVYGNPPKVEVTDGCDEWIYWIDKNEVIPYNEKTMHLLGTTEDYKEE